MAKAVEFKYAPMFQVGEDKTEYRLLTKEGVTTAEFEGKQIVKVSKEALTLLAQQAFHDVEFMLRREHNEQVAKILTDPEASENDKYVALQFLRKAETAAKGILPFCQDLMANSVPILVLGTALYYCYPTLANRIMLITWLGSGLLTWCIGSPDSTHVGASALIYGLNLFLIISGFIRGNRMLIVISLIMVFLYGSFLWGMIPAFAIPQHISWEGHLSGAVTGVLLAFFYRRQGPQKEEHQWEEEDDNDQDNNDSGEKPYWDVPMPTDDELTIQYRFRH